METVASSLSEMMVLVICLFFAPAEQQEVRLALAQPELVVHERVWQAADGEVRLLAAWQPKGRP